MFAIFLFNGCDREETYIVSFDANGGTGRMQSQLFESGVSQALTQNLYTRDGYTFSGWNTMQAGNGIAYTNGQTITVTSDMTLYAQWTNNGTSGGGQSGCGTGSGAQGEEPHMGGNGVLNGHDYVDLGLPSGTKWATCNVGASAPEDYGYYFAWGEITPKDYYCWNNYKYCNGGGDYDGLSRTLTKYCHSVEYGYNGFTDTLTILQYSDDAATANWGAGWRMPTRTEMLELLINCTYTFITNNNVNGIKFTGPNGNSIFLPAAGYRLNSELKDARFSGYYWSSSLSTNYPDYAWNLDNLNNVGMEDYHSSRYFGLPVRAVCNGDNIGGDANIYVLPTVTTGSASSITANTASLSGNVTSDGGATVTSRGFLYGTISSNLTQSVQSGSGTGNFTAYLTDLTSGITYYYKAYATNSAGTSYGEVMSFTPETATILYSEPTGYVNGYGYVDLGLPSGTKWATCNVGADTPEGYGEYFAWGETTTKETYNWSTYRYSNGGEGYNELTKYCNNAEYGYNGFTDALTTLEVADDAATANLGTGWRMPTQMEMAELYNNCSYVWTTQNGVNGCLFTGLNGNSIFLPAAGYYHSSEFSGVDSHGFYWSSSLYGYPHLAKSSSFNSNGFSHREYLARIYGLSIRAVCNR